MRKHYKPGDDVIPKVEVRREESDSEDERLMAEVRDLSMADVDPETARRRAERGARSGGRQRRQEGATDAHSSHRPEEFGRAQQPSRWASQQVQLSEARLREHDASEPQVEHQPSLRSLLSASPIDSHDVQQEVLQSIYADGLLDGIDIDNLTAEQEEELTERIAEAYRRRQRRQERSANRERRPRTSRSPQPATAGAETQSRHHARTDSASSQQPRATRPPVSRPHIFEQATLQPATHQRRSPSSTSQRSNRSANRTDVPTSAPASRSATDLSERPTTAEAARERQRRMSSNARSNTDPRDEHIRPHTHRARASSGTTRNIQSEVFPSAHPLEVVRRQAGPTNNSSPSLPTLGPSSAAAAANQNIRPSTSTAAFAPEPISSATPVHEAITNNPQSSQSPPQLTCSRCEKPDIQHTLHYHCPWCRNGTFNLCQPCYRQGRGCDHWFGFGYMAHERWRRLAPPEGWPVGSERPHTLIPRRYTTTSTTDSAAPLPPVPQQQPPPPTTPILQEGAFCDSCSAFANECYWHCPYCLEGAWGFCNTCVQQGRHCTHPLTPLAHLSTLHRHRHQHQHSPHHLDPAKATFTPVPHLRQDSYVALPILTDCDICRRPIPPNSTRFHCLRCSFGDYDVCAECYYGLVAVGKVSQGNGPNGWRRCLQGHRMMIVGYQDMPEGGGGQQRVVVREMVGGRRYKDEGGGVGVGATPPPAPPADSSLGARCLALWSWFPPEGVTDELVCPKNAEITEVEDMNGDYSVGVYAGVVGLFPSNHVRRL